MAQESLVMSSLSNEAAFTAEGEVTFRQVLEYETENQLQDIAEPDEEIHALLSDEDIIYLEQCGDKLPPVAPGRQITPSMINFVKSVVKAYRICEHPK
jgi:hypothetical protein